MKGRTLRAVVPSRMVLTTPTQRWRRRMFFSSSVPSLIPRGTYLSFDEGFVTARQ